MKKNIEEDYNIVAYINFNKDINNSDKQVLKDIEEIKKYVTTNVVDEIFLDINMYLYSDLIEKLKLTGIPISIKITDFTKNYLGNSVIKNISNQTYITSVTRAITLRQAFLKRTMDIVGALFGILITMIVAIIIYPKIQKESKGSLIFKQKRVGQNGNTFYMYKFRSMYVDAEKRKKELLEKNDLDTTLMFKMKNDPRVFPFGQKLRDWSLDELPQFINVLKGDMSLVGTRPPTIEEYYNYELHHLKRLSAKPGITGLWQVSGRSDIGDFERVVELDIEYIQNWSLSNDIKIILKTIQVVLKKEGSR